MKLRDLDLQNLQKTQMSIHSELISGLYMLKKEFPEYFDKISHFDAAAFEKIMGEYIFISMSTVSRGPIRDSIQEAKNDCRELKSKLGSIAFLDMLEQALSDRQANLIPVLKIDLCLFSCTQALKLLRECSIEQASLSEGFIKNLFQGDCSFNFSPFLKLKSLELLKKHNLLDEDSTVLSRVLASNFPVGVYFALNELERLERLASNNINKVLDSTTDLALLVDELRADEIDALEATSNMRANF